MAATVGQLVVNLRAETASFAKDLGKARTIAFGNAKEIERSLKLVGGALLGLGTAAVTGLAALTKSQIDAADRFHELSQSTGVSTETLSGFAHLAEKSGVTTEDLATGLAKLARSAVEAAQGAAKPSAAFRALGIDVRDAGGNLKGTEQIAIEVSKAFQKLPDGPQKTALAIELMGRSGARFIPFLNENLKEAIETAKRFGFVVTAETAAAADKFNDSLKDLQKIVSSVGLGIAEELLPELNRLARGLVDVGNEAGGLNLGRAIGKELSDEIKKTIHDLKQLELLWARLKAFFSEPGPKWLPGGPTAEEFQKATGRVQELRKEINQQRVALGMPLAFPEVGLDRFGEAFRAWGNAAKREVAEVEKAFLDVNARLDAAAGRTSPLGLPLDLGDGKKKPPSALALGTDAAEAATKKLAEALRNVREELERQIATFGKSKEAVELYKLGILGASAADLEHVKRLQEKLRLLETTTLAKRGFGIEKAKAPEEPLELKLIGKGLVLIRDKAAEAEQELARLEETLLSLKPEWLKSLEGNPLEPLIGGFEWPEPIPVTFTQRLEEARAALKELSDPAGFVEAHIRTLNDALREGSIGAAQYAVEMQRVKLELTASGQFALGLQQAITGFTDSMAEAIAQGGGFGDVLRSLAQDIIKLTIQLLVMRPILEALFGAGASGGPLGGLLGKLFGLAEGGPARPGQRYVGGEKGPEIFVPDSLRAAFREAALPLGRPVRGITGGDAAREIGRTLTGTSFARFDFAAAELRGLSVIGKHGPELFVPRMPGVVIPADLTKRLMAGFRMPRFAFGGFPEIGKLALAGEGGAELFFPTMRSGGAGAAGRGGVQLRMGDVHINAPGADAAEIARRVRKTQEETVKMAVAYLRDMEKRF